MYYYHTFIVLCTYLDLSNPCLYLPDITHTRDQFYYVPIEWMGRTRRKKLGARGPFAELNLHSRFRQSYFNNVAYNL